MKIKYSYKKEGVDKEPKIISDFLDCFWREFVSINEDSPKLQWPKRSVIIKNCGYNRRNAYKHLHKLVFYNIFEELDDKVVPTAFIFIINGRLYNPSKFVFETELPEELTKHKLYTITPKIPLNILTKLMEIIDMQDGTKLSDYLSISFEVPIQLSFSHEYEYTQLPKTTRAYTGWDQKDNKIKEGEEKLLALLTPFQDPFDHNTFISFKGEDDSPFIKLDENNNDYVLAGWCATIKDNHLLGNFSDSEEPGDYIEVYDHSKKLLQKIPIVFPSAFEGVSFMAEHPTVSTRVDSAKDNFLGYYDFKNNVPDQRWLMNHLIMSFSRLKVPKAALYIKIKTAAKSYFALASVFPYSHFPKDFIKKRMEAKDSKEFAQNNETIFYFDEIKIKGLAHYKKMNEFLQKSTYLIEKNKLLMDAYKELELFQQEFDKTLEQEIKKKEKLSESFIRLLLASMSAQLMLPLSIRGKDSKFLKIISEATKRNYELMKKVLTHVQKTDTECVFLPSLLMTHYRQFRNLRIYFREELETKSFKKMLDHNENIIDKSIEPDFRLEFYKWQLALEKNFLEKGMLTEGEVSTKGIDELYRKISQLYDDLSVFIDAAIKKSESEEEKQVLLNKLNLYKALSLHFSFSNILFQSRFIQQHSKDKNISKILGLLEEFGKELF